jgi:hypothetical protein
MQSTDPSFLVTLARETIMPKIRTTLAFTLSTMGVLLLASSILAPARATQESVSLLQTLELWKYPGSTMLEGASMSDAGNPDIQDVICKAVLTTPDAFDDVVRFYEKKAADVAQPRAVIGQNDSKDRPIALRIFNVHRTATTTTLVISRGEGEKATHIAWSHYMKF